MGPGKFSPVFFFFFWLFALDMSVRVEYPYRIE